MSGGIGGSGAGVGAGAGGAGGTGFTGSPGRAGGKGRGEGGGGGGGGGGGAAGAGTGGVGGLAVRGGEGGHGGNGGVNGLTSTSINIGGSLVAGNGQNGSDGGDGNSSGGGGGGGAGGFGVVVTGSGANSIAGSIIAGSGGSGGLGGAGGGGMGGAGGSGGVGLEFKATKTTFTNMGSITAGDGGAGGNGGYGGDGIGGVGGAGASGGDGVEFTASGANFLNSGGIAGGNGGAGGGGASGFFYGGSSGSSGGNGGAGAAFTAGQATFINSGGIAGGNGGAGGFGGSGVDGSVGGSGGVSVTFTASGAKFSNTGNLTGGAGGIGGDGGDKPGFEQGPGSGGMGGAGGAGVAFTGSEAIFSNSGNVSGGTGGTGGDGGGGFDTGPGPGGDGGPGGVGVVFTAGGSKFVNSGRITGGAGASANDSFVAFNGGAGGGGVEFTTGLATFVNSGVVTGGNGSSAENFLFAGAGGVGVKFMGSDATFTNSGKVTGGTGGDDVSGGSDGAGGAGLVGSGLKVIDSGAITSGLSGDRRRRAHAIDFIGGVNSLTLEAGFQIGGFVLAFSPADTLALGGTTDNAFDVSRIGSSAQYRGFGVFKKTGSSIWTLTGVTSAHTPWAINGGKLAVSSDGALGDPSGALSFGGGALEFLTSFATSRSIILNQAGGAFDTQGHNATLGGLISGPGELTKVGAGTLTFSHANTYAGGTSIGGGTLQVRSDEALGAPSGALSFDGVGGRLQFLPAASAFTTNRAIFLNANGVFDTRGSNATLGGLISGAGELIKVGAGTLELSHANAYSGGTLLKGGAVDLAALGAAGANAITFGSPATLEIDNAALSHVKLAHNAFGNAILGFGADDVIDLTGLSFAAGATASYSASTDLLTVKSVAVSDTLTLTTGLSNPAFHLMSDQHGGTAITVTQGPAPVGPSGVASGTPAPNVALLANYMASAFVQSSDGHGSANIAPPQSSAPLNLAQPSAHAA